MSTYPPNQTTPKSGNYLWNWLGSPLKKFAAALAPYLGGGGDSGYSYTEINISSAELLNPGTLPDATTGKVLLPALPTGQFYDWYFYLEYIPGTILYTTAPEIRFAMDTINNFGSAYSMTSTLTTELVARVWQVSSKGHEYTYPSKSGAFLYAKWGGGIGDFTDGDGTMKVKLWYKIVNFG